MIKELQVAIHRQITTGYPIVIPILLDIRYRDLPKELMIDELFVIVLEGKDLEYVKEQIANALRYYREREVEDLLRLGKGTVFWDQKLLVQIIPVEMSNFQEENSYSLTISALGSPSIKLIEPENGKELDAVIRKVLSENRIELSLINGVEADEIEVHIETKIKEELLDGIVKEEKNISKKEFFGFRADIVLRNKSDFFIKNYLVHLETKPIEIGILKTKMDYQFKRMKKSVRKIREESKLKRLIEEYEQLDFAKISRLLAKGQTLFRILKHDIAFPNTKFKSAKMSGIDLPGDLEFEVDIDPQATISYQIIGADIVELFEEEMRNLEQKEIDRITRKKAKKGAKIK